jgi:hypothetical protein
MTGSDQNAKSPGWPLLAQNGHSTGTYQMGQIQNNAPRQAAEGFD